MRVLILFLLVQLFLMSDSNLSEQLDKKFNSDDETQREIKSISDFNELEKLLKKFVNLGDTRKFLILGSLYDTDIIYKDSLIHKKESEKARKYYISALKENYGVAAIYLIKHQNDINEALLLLENSLHSKNNTKEDNINIAISYNALILEKFYDNKNYVKRALDLTYKIALNNNNPILDFSIANLLYLEGITENANIFLNAACNNPQCPQAIIESCKNSIGITNNLKKSKDCQTCGKLQ